MATELENDTLKLRYSLNPFRAKVSHVSHAHASVHGGLKKFTHSPRAGGHRTLVGFDSGHMFMLQSRWHSVLIPRALCIWQLMVRCLGCLRRTRKCRKMLLLSGGRQWMRQSLNFRHIFPREGGSHAACLLRWLGMVSPERERALQSPQPPNWVHQLAVMDKHRRQVPRQNLPSSLSLLPLPHHTHSQAT